MRRISTRMLVIMCLIFDHTHALGYFVLLLRKQTVRIVDVQFHGKNEGVLLIVVIPIMEMNPAIESTPLDDGIISRDGRRCFNFMLSFIFYTVRKFEEFIKY